MGLLSNPSDNKQLISKKFIGKQKVLSTLFYIGSIVWLVCLSYRQFNAGNILIFYCNSFLFYNIYLILGTYFSENALLPGLVHSNFKEDFLARQYVAAMKV